MKAPTFVSSKDSASAGAPEPVLIPHSGPTMVLDVVPTPTTQPGLKELGIQELTLHPDGRNTAGGTPVDPTKIFDLTSSTASQHTLWDTTSHTLTPNQPLPDPFRTTNIYTFPAANEHFTFSRADYIQASFFQPVQLYILLVSTSKVPQWLRNDFNRLPESKASLGVSWQFGMHTRVLALLSQKLSTISSARLQVWVRREHCVPGVRYSLGGPEGNSPLEDYTYLLAWRKLGPQEVVQPGDQAGRAGLLSEERSGTALGGEAAEDRRVLLGRMAAAVAEDDLEQLRRAVETYRARAAASPHPGAWPPPSFLTSRGVPLTGVAAQRNAQPRLVAYLVAQGAEMDAAAFRYLLANSKALPGGGFSDVPHLVLSCLAQQRNPIAAAMGFARELAAAADSNSAKAREWRELASKLRSAAVDLVGCLEKLERPPAGDSAAAAATAAAPAAGTTDSSEAVSSAAAAAAASASISDVLAPRGVACSLNDVSPLQMAYDTNDLDFMSAPVVQGYLQDRWLGPDYILQALQDKGATLHYQDHHLMLRVLEGSGFVGSLGRPLFRFHSYLVHLLVFAPRAFFDSPRGRWIFKMFLEAFFLYVFHSVQLMPDDDFTLRWQHVAFLLYVGGQLVDEVQENAHQYGGRLAAYFSSGFNLVEAAGWGMMLGCIGLKAAMWGLPGRQDHPHWEALRTCKELLLGCASILVWARLLQFIIPLYDGVGSLLMVVSLMFREVFKFAVPGMLLLTGVAFSLFSAFRYRDIPELSSFPMTMLKLFRTFLGETMFDLYVDEPDTAYNLYGNIITLLYALVATVVLANLLIALISYHFQPEKTESQSRFQMAEILAHYEYVVDQRLVGAPFSGPQLLAAAVLPAGRRQKGSSSWLAEKAGLPPMDGIVVAGEDTANKFLPTGTHELPYLLFLLTLYPALLLLSWALYFGMAPYAICYFTLAGYRRWTGEAAGPAGLKGPTRQGSSGRVHPDPSSSAAPTTAAAAAATAKAPAGSAAAGAAVDMLELADEVGGGGALHASSGPVVAAGEEGMLGGGGPALGGGEEEGGGVVQRLAPALRHCLSAARYLLTRPLWLLLGCCGYLGVLGGGLLVLWMGAYTWLGRLAFHAYWVLRGWVQGLLGGDNVVFADKTATTTTSSTSSPSTAAAAGGAGQQQQRRQGVAGLRERSQLVRVQQAALRNGGQVITLSELARSLRAAGFSKADISAAAAGPSLAPALLGPTGSGALASAPGPAGADVAAGGAGGRGTPQRSEASLQLRQPLRVEEADEDDGDVEEEEEDGAGCDVGGGMGEAGGVRAAGGGVREMPGLVRSGGGGGGSGGGSKGGSGGGSGSPMARRVASS